MIDPAALEALLRVHAVETVLQNKQSDQIAIDGKALRGMCEIAFSCLRPCLHSVSAWCHEMALFWARSKLNTSPIYPWAWSCPLKILKILRQAFLSQFFDVLCKVTVWSGGLSINSKPHKPLGRIVITSSNVLIPDLRDPP